MQNQMTQIKDRAGHRRGHFYASGEEAFVNDRTRHLATGREAIVVAVNMGGKLAIRWADIPVDVMPKGQKRYANIAVANAEFVERNGQLDTPAHVGIDGFPNSLGHEIYRGVHIHVVKGPFSNNGYIVAPFQTVKHDLSGLEYDQVNTSAPGGWTFFKRVTDDHAVLGFDHAHAWEKDREHRVSEVLAELRDCVDDLIAIGYIREAVAA